MKNFLLRSFAILMLIGLTLPLFAASTPAVDDGKWYYVKSQRFDTGGPWWTFNATDNVAVPGALTKADNQKFKLVAVGETGNVTLQDYSGLKITASNDPRGLWDATGPATGWTLTANTVNGVTGYAFPGENAGLHQGASSWNWRVAAGWYSLADNCTFFFYEVGEDLELNIAIDDAKTRLALTTVGTGIGTTPQSAVDTYQAAIATASGTLGSTDATAIQNAINALATATAAFVDAAIPLVTSSTAENPVWYLIKNTARGGKGSTVFTTTFGGQLRATTAVNTVKADGTSTGAAAPTLNHLFRFERLSDGTYKIVNAAMASGEVLQAASGGYSSQAINYGTPASTKWKLGLFGYNATLDINELKISSAGNNTVWHLDGGNSVLSYDGGAGTASSWYTEVYTGDVTPLFITGLTNKLAEAKTLYIATLTGTRFLNAPQAARTAFADAIATAQAIYDDPASTPESYLPAAEALDAAIIAYKPNIIKTPATLLSESNDKYRWYWIKSTATQAYAKDMVISAGMRDVGEKYTFEPKAEQISDNQLFRFELTDDQTAVLHIINKTGTYMASNGAITEASTAGNTFAINPLVDAYSFNIKPTSVSALHAQATGSHIVNWAGAVGSASAWTFEYAMETPKMITSNQKLNNDRYTIRLENSVIKVDGVETFEVYSVSGQRINQHTPLNSGVYLIKFNNVVEKVMVR
jgi:hypothetical protein